MIKVNKEELFFKDDEGYASTRSKEIEINENNIQFLQDFHYAEFKSTCRQINIVFSNKCYIRTYDYPYNKLKEMLNKFSEYIDKYENKYLINNNLVAYIDNQPFGKNIHFTDGNYINIELT